jgi:hypothetical protein
VASGSRVGEVPADLCGKGCACPGRRPGCRWRSRAWLVREGVGGGLEPPRPMRAQGPQPPKCRSLGLLRVFRCSSDRYRRSKWHTWPLEATHAFSALNPPLLPGTGPTVQLPAPLFQRRDFSPLSMSETLRAWVGPASPQLRSGTGWRVLVAPVARWGGQSSPMTRLASASTTTGSNCVPAPRRSSAIASGTESWAA